MIMVAIAQNRSNPYLDPVTLGNQLPYLAMQLINIPLLVFLFSRKGSWNSR